MLALHVLILKGLLSKSNDVYQIEPQTVFTLSQCWQVRMLNYLTYITEPQTVYTLCHGVSKLNYLITSSLTLFTPFVIVLAC